MRTTRRDRRSIAQCAITAPEQERSDEAAVAAIDRARSSGANRKLRAIIAHAHDVLIREATVRSDLRPRR